MRNAVGVVLLSAFLCAALSAEEATYEGRMVSDWVGDLSSSEPEVCRAACWVLGRLGARAAEAAPALGRALSDESPEVRSQAALSLGAMGAEGAAVLVEALQDADSLARSEAARGLSYLRPPPDAAVPGLIPMLRDPDVDVRSCAARALALIGPGAKDALPALTNRLADPDKKVAAAAGEAIVGLGREARPEIVRIARMVEDEERLEVVARVLTGLGQEAEDAVPVLVEWLRSCEPRMRYHRCEIAVTVAAIGRTGPRALVALMGDPDLELRCVAARALGGAAVSAPEEARAALAAADPELRIAAIGALSPLGRAAIPILTGAAADPDPAIRGAAKGALPGIPESIPLLREFLLDPVPELRRFNEAALRDIAARGGAAEVAALLMEALGNDDSSCQ